MVAEGQRSVINGRICFDNSFTGLPSLNEKEGIAKYGPVAKNGALEIDKL